MSFHTKAHCKNLTIWNRTFSWRQDFTIHFLNESRPWSNLQKLIVIICDVRSQTQSNPYLFSSFLFLIILNYNKQIIFLYHNEGYTPTRNLKNYWCLWMTDLMKWKQAKVDVISSDLSGYSLFPISVYYKHKWLYYFLNS